jgi:hypothetical protein
MHVSDTMHSSDKICTKISLSIATAVENIKTESDAATQKVRSPEIQPESMAKGEPNSKSEICDCALVTVMPIFSSM